MSTDDLIEMARQHLTVVMNTRSESLFRDLLAEVERLRLVREEWRRLYNVAHARAEKAEAERDRLRDAVDRVRHILSSGYADFDAFQADLREAVALDEHQGQP